MPYPYQDKPYTPAIVTTPPTSSVPGSGNVTASSVSGPALGFTPFLTPEQQATLTRGLSNLTYSLPAGGYVSRDEANNANSYYSKFGAGGGGDPRANRAAGELFGVVGNAPTVPRITAALGSLYQRTGYQPALGPSFNERLAGTGFEGPYRGPYEYEGYHPFRRIMSQYGFA
jgi:hypothetical protein